jgi:hypothetical protein
MEMKQILLTINGSIPTNSVFQYSVGLCKRLQTQLNILQFVKDTSLQQCNSSTRSRVERLGKFLENSFVGVAFAEQGAFGMADDFLPGTSDSLKNLIKTNKIEIPFKVGLGSGNLKAELFNYVENHQKIILTIFDPAKDTQNDPKQQLEMINEIKKNLCVPLVVVK